MASYRRIILRRRSTAPVLLSLYHDLIDTAGGPLVATGLRLTGATHAEVSRDGETWVEAAVSGVTDVAVTIAVPALAAGAAWVRVVVGGRASNALGFEAFGWTDTSAPCRHLWMPYLGGVTVVDGRVSRIDDLVGAMHQEQAAHAHRFDFVPQNPLYGGQPTMTGRSDQSGAGMVATTTGTIAAPMSVLAIGHCGGTNSALFSAGDVAPYNLLWCDNREGSKKTEFFNTVSGNLAAVGVTIDIPSAVLIAHNSTTAADAWQMYVNDLETPKNYNQRAWGNTDRINLGGGGAGVPPNRGAIAGVIVYEAVLSASDRAKLAKLIQFRFGLANVTG